MAFVVQIDESSNVSGADQASAGITFLGDEPLDFLEGVFTDYAVTGDPGARRLLNPAGSVIAYEVEASPSIGPAFNAWFLTLHENQSAVGDGNGTFIAWDVAVLDTDGYHSGSDPFVTIPATGWYELWVNISFEQSFTGNGTGHFSVYLARNEFNDPIPGALEQNRDTNRRLILHAGCLAFLAKGDQVAVVVTQDTGDGVDIVADDFNLNQSTFQGKLTAQPAG